MRKPGLIQIFILAERDVFPVFPPSESVPPPVLDGVVVGGGGVLAAADKGINISEKVLQRKTEPTSGVGAVTTATSLPQHHLTILSEDMKKQPPPQSPQRGVHGNGKQAERTVIQLIPHTQRAPLHPPNPLIRFHLSAPLNHAVMRLLLPPHPPTPTAGISI